MPPYDSESSSDDENEFQVTNVILGYVSTEATDDDISHVGGHPIWLDKTVTPSADFARCRSCNGFMRLLLELHADLQHQFPEDQRRLYVWTCRKKTCSRKPGAIRAFREVRKARRTRPVKPAQPPEAPSMSSSSNLGQALFGGNATTPSGAANPFSLTGAAVSSTKNPFSASSKPSVSHGKTVDNAGNETEPPSETFAEKLKLNAAEPVSPPSKERELWPNDSAFSNPFPFFYLDSGAEELDHTPAVPETTATAPSRAQYDTEDISSSAVNEKDAFESELDKTFQKFSDVAGQNPEQVLRYEFKGQPLLYSGADAVSSRFVMPHGKAGAVKGMPRCGCGAQRTFEMQLMPNLIYEIEKDEAMDIEDGMEWGTIIVGTCVNNCGGEGVVDFKEEWVGVQWEERLKK